MGAPPPPAMGGAPPPPPATGGRPPNPFGGGGRGALLAGIQGFSKGGLKKGKPAAEKAGNTVPLLK